MSSSKRCKTASKRDASQMLECRSTRSQTRRKEANRVLEEKREMNTRMLISKLPPEVLLLVFFILKDACTLDAREKPDVHVLDWIRVTHVCHSWRELSLSASKLWSYIRCTAPSDLPWAIEMLHRSKQSPLSVRLDRLDPTTAPVETHKIAGLIDNLHRFREVDLRNFGSRALVRIMDQVMAPLLHTLKIDCPPSRLVTFCLSNRILRTESLRKLSYVNCHVDPNSEFLHGLTHLGLRQARTIEDILCILSQTANLEVADVGIFEPSEEGSDHLVVRSAKIHLPVLKTLRICASTCDVATILSNIVAPHVLRLRIFALEMGQRSPSDNFVSILRPLSAHFLVLEHGSVPKTTKPSPDIRSMRLCRSKSDVLIVQAFKEAFSQEQLSENGMDPILDSTFSWGVNLDGDFQSRILKPLLDHLPLNNLVTLQLFIWCAMSGSAWSSTFGLLPNLESILVSGALDILPFVGSLLPDDPSSKPLKLSFPLLNSITFHEFVCEPDTGEWMTPVLSTILKIFVARDFMGFPIKHLTLLGCPPLSDSQLDICRLAVPDVQQLKDSIQVDIFRAYLTTVGRISSSNVEHFLDLP